MDIIVQFTVQNAVKKIVSFYCLYSFYCCKYLKFLFEPKSLVKSEQPNFQSDVHVDFPQTELVSLQMQLQSFGCKSTNIIRRHFKNLQGCKLTLKKLNSDSVKKEYILNYVMRANIIFTNFKKQKKTRSIYYTLYLLHRLIGCQ